MRLSLLRPAVAGLTSLAAAALMVPTALHAQGSLSTLGLGYPVAGTSTRVSATGGAFSEFDALTPTNPAAIGGVLRTVIGVQAEPEFRTLSYTGGRERTTAQRIPLIGVIFPAGRGVAVGFSMASYLDRSYTLRTTGTAVVDDSTIGTTSTLDVRGGIGQLRAAVGWQINSRFRVGVAGHLFTGDNLVARDQRFADTVNFGRIQDTSKVTYYGTALSVGGDMRLFKGLAASVSYRAGNGMDASIRDTVRASASVPNTLGASMRFEGIPGTVLAAGIEQVSWSRLRGLGTSLSSAQDSKNWRVGAETGGPRWQGALTQVRVGFARNQLPFSVTSARITETRWSAGLGVPIARDAAALDFSLQRASRTLPGTPMKESSWFLGIGLQIRPLG